MRVIKWLVKALVGAVLGAVAFWGAHAILRIYVSRPSLVMITAIPVGAAVVVGYLGSWFLYTPKHFPFSISMGAGLWLGGPIYYAVGRHLIWDDQALDLSQLASDLLAFPLKTWLSAARDMSLLGCLVATAMLIFIDLRTSRSSG